MKIYLDTCCFNRPFDDQTQMGVHLETQAKLFIQEQIDFVLNMKAVDEN